MIGFVRGMLDSLWTVNMRFLLLINVFNFSSSTLLVNCLTSLEGRCQCSTTPGHESMINQFFCFERQRAAKCGETLKKNEPKMFPK